MENKSSNGWKFFALLFGALLAGVVGLYIYKQQNPDYDPWEDCIFTFAKSKVL